MFGTLFCHCTFAMLASPVDSVLSVIEFKTRTSMHLISEGNVDNYAKHLAGSC